MTYDFYKIFQKSLHKYNSICYTENGYCIVVLINNISLGGANVQKSTKINGYKRFLIKNKLEENLLIAEEEIRNGKVRNATDVFKEWKTKYGI